MTITQLALTLSLLSVQPTTAQGGAARPLQCTQTTTVNIDVGMAGPMASPVASPVPGSAHSTVHCTDGYTDTGAAVISSRQNNPQH